MGYECRVELLEAPIENLDDFKHPQKVFKDPETLEEILMDGGYYGKCYHIEEDFIYLSKMYIDEAFIIDVMGEDEMYPVRYWFVNGTVRSKEWAPPILDEDIDF